MTYIKYCVFLGKQVVGRPKNFTDIMKHYRNQPQASSHVYRSVLLRKKDISKETSLSGGNKSNDKVIQQIGNWFYNLQHSNKQP